MDGVFSWALSVGLHLYMGYCQGLTDGCPDAGRFVWGTLIWAKQGAKSPPNSPSYFLQSSVWKSDFSGDLAMRIREDNRQELSGR